MPGNPIVARHVLRERYAGTMVKHVPEKKTLLTRNCQQFW